MRDPSYNSTELFRINVRRLMDRDRINQTELAKRAKLTPAQISNLLNRKGSINLRSADKIAEIFNVGLFELFLKGRFEPSDQQLLEAYEIVRQDLRKRLVRGGWGWPPNVLSLGAAFLEFLEARSKSPTGKQTPE